ncbi:MAG: TonB-dependent receptor [Bacteroidetes bacterium]|nr:TonB-dependent receptor [Bacteroidota bacterium]
MNPLFDYLIKSSLWLIAFYAVYRLLLSKETFANFNRFFLLFGLLASVVMPFMVIYRTVHISAPITDNLPIVTSLPAIQIQQPVSWEEMLQKATTALYVAGILFLVLKTAISLIPLLKEIGTRNGDSRLIYTRTHQTPFSFGKYIFIPESTSDDELGLILTHEYTHTKQLHYLDLWLARFICILQFFNPVVWLYSKAVQENCEFIADRQTLQQTNLKEQYFQLLIKYSLNHQLSPVSLHFSFPLIFKRIQIMKQKQSSKLASLKSLVVVPLACCIMAGFAQTKVIEDTPSMLKTAAVPSQLLAQNIQQTKKTPKRQTQTQTQAKTTQTSEEEQESTKNEIVVVGYANNSGTSKASSENNEVFTVVEELPHFADGNVSEYLARNIKYPADAQRRGAQGRVICQFVVEKDGSVSSVKVLRSVDPLLDAEACRVIYNMPKWIPGKQRGEIVRVKYTLPVQFALR